MKKQYKTPHDWYNSNKSKLRKYKSEWIAFTNDGVIVHDKNLFKVANATDNLLLNIPLIIFLTAIFLNRCGCYQLDLKTSNVMNGNLNIGSY